MFDPNRLKQKNPLIIKGFCVFVVIPLGNFNIFQMIVYQAFNGVFTPKGNVKGDNLFSQFYTSI
jgi:hypothetical protein